MTLAGVPEPWSDRPLTPSAGCLVVGSSEVHLSGPATGVLTLALRPAGAMRTVLEGGAVDLQAGPASGLRLTLELPAALQASRTRKAAELDGPVSFRGGIVVRSAGSGTVDVMGMLTLRGVTDVAVVRIGLSASVEQDALLVHARTLVSRRAHGLQVPQRRARSTIGLSIRALITPS